MMTRTVFFVAAAAATLAASAGCSDSGEPQTPPTGVVESDIVKMPLPMKDTDAVATVGDRTLTWGELNAKVDGQLKMFQQMQPVPSEQLPMVKQQLRRAETARFIEEKVFDHALATFGTTIDDAYRAEQMKLTEARAGMSFADILKSSPMGEEETLKIAERTWLVNKMIEEQVVGKIVVTDDEVKAEAEKIEANRALVKEEMEGYAKAIAEGTSTIENLAKANSLIAEPQEFPLAQMPAEMKKILTETPLGQVTAVTEIPGAIGLFKVLERDDGTDTAKAVEEAKAKIEAARQRVLGGEDFAAVAREVSDCPSGKRDGGNLGEFGRGMMVPEFEKAAFEQPVGEVGPVIETSFGWHIVKVTARDDAAGKVTASHILVMRPEGGAKAKAVALVKQYPAVMPPELIRNQLRGLRQRDAVAKFFNEQKAAAGGVTCPLYPELAK